jgi:hypothetical protein
MIFIDFLFFGSFFFSSSSNRQMPRYLRRRCCTMAASLTSIHTNAKSAMRTALGVPLCADESLPVAMVKSCAVAHCSECTP